MIINFDDIRAIRPIADNINDTKRLKTYVDEVEELDIVPVLGVSLVKTIREYKESGTVPPDTITEEQIKSLMDGCYFTSKECGGGDVHCNGLKKAAAYLVYSRFIKNNPTNVTAFGVKFKDTQYSEDVDEGNIIRQSNEAYKIGTAYINQCVDYLKSIGYIETKKNKRKKIKSIG